MWRFLAGALAAMLLMAAGLVLWRGAAASDAPDPIPEAPAATPTRAPALLAAAPRPAAPPEASPKTREQKRFGRADKDDDGRITRAELLEPRRKAFAKLDTNGDGRLAFEEWATKTIGKFDGADDDGNGALTAAEYATTAPKPRAKPRCSC